MDKLSTIEEHSRHSDSITALMSHNGRLFSASADMTIKVICINQTRQYFNIGFNQRSFLQIWNINHCANVESGNEDTQNKTLHSNSTQEGSLNESETRPVTPTIIGAPIVEFHHSNTATNVQAVDVLMPMREELQQR